MKILIAYLIFFPVLLLAQSPGILEKIYFDDKSYDEIVKEGIEYYSDPERRQDNQYGYKDWQRFRTRWEGKNQVEGVTDGSFNHGIKAYSQFNANRGAFCQSSVNSWTSLGPFDDNALECNIGRVESIAQDPNNENVIYAGTLGGGIYKSTNGGGNWVNLSQSDDDFFNAVTGIVAKSNGDLFISVSYEDYNVYNSGGVYKLNGTDWVEQAMVPELTNDLSTRTTARTTQMKENPFTGDIYLLAGGQVDVPISDPDYNVNGTFFSALWKKDFNGTDFIEVPGTRILWSNGGNINPRFWRDVEFKSNGEIFLSSDDDQADVGSLIRHYPGFGTAWNNILTPTTSIIGLSSVITDRIEMELSPNGDLNAIFSDVNNNLTLIRYSNSQWGLVNSIVNSASSGYWKNCFLISPLNGQHSFISGIYTRISEDDYTTWSTAILEHIDTRVGIHATYQGNPCFLVGTDGGIERITFDGNGFTQGNWECLNGANFGNTQFFCLSTSETTFGQVTGGSIDNRGYTYNESTNLWINILGGDIGTFKYSPISNQYVYLSHAAIGGQPGIELLNWSPQVYNYWRPVYATDQNNFYVAYSEIQCYNNEQCGLPISDFYSIHGKVIPVEDFDVNLSSPNTVVAVFETPTYSNYQSEIRILRTTDGMNTWQSLDDGVIIGTNDRMRDVTRWRSYSKLVSNPLNPDEFWLSMSGFSTIPGERQVFHTTDGGLTFEDMSAGLDGLPINDIEFQEGSNDFNTGPNVPESILYLCTDGGVYYFDNTSQEWVCYSSDLPNALVNDIEINYLTGRLYCATYGHGIFYTDLLSNKNYQRISKPEINSPGQPSGNVVINSNTTWEGQHAIQGNLIIEPGATLYCKECEIIFFSENSKCILREGDMTQNGGRLTLEGGIISKSNCLESWKGIEVRGNSLLPQGNPGNSPQGVLITRGILSADGNYKQAVIDGAEIGVLLGQRAIPPVGPPVTIFNYNKSGGIIVSSNTLFTNITDVLFTNYKNFEPPSSNEIRNYSEFENCIFNTSVLPNNIIDNYRVKLLYTKGVRFNGCTFNDAVGTNGSTSDEIARSQGVGIYALNSSIVVSGECSYPLGAGQICPETDYDRNIFEGLYKGIELNETSTIYSSRIDRNTFTNCWHSIVCNGTSNTVVTRNKFNMRPLLHKESVGLYLNQSSRFTISENSFTRDHSSSGFSNQKPTVALVSNRAPSINSEIYNNSFELTVNHDKGGADILVQGDPTGALTPANLQLKCNNFNSAVTSNTNEGFIRFSENGDLPPQGDPNNPIGNTFFLNSSTPANSDYEIDAIFNQAPQPNTPGYTYYHHDQTATPGTKVEPTLYTNQVVTLDNTGDDYIKAEDCPDDIVIGKDPVVLVPKLLIDEDEVSFQKNKLDGGDTNALLSAIYSSNAGQLKNLLIQNSPYLSNAVLLTYINSNPPNGHLQQVLEANSPLDATVWDAIQDLNPGLNSNSLSQLAALQNGISQVQLQQDIIAGAEQERDNTVAKIIQLYLQNDTTSSSLDSAQRYMETYWMESSPCEVAAFYISRGNFTEAQYIINQKLAEDPNNAYCILQSLALTYEQQVERCMLLDATTKDELDDIQQSHLYGCVNANVILSEVDSLPLPLPVVLPFDGGVKSQLLQGNREIKSSLFSIYPNPNSGNFNIKSEVVGTLTLFDLLGKKITDVQIEIGDNTYSNLNLAKGVYLYRFGDEVGRIIVE